jgi:hypothetical protein
MEREKGGEGKGGREGGRGGRVAPTQPTHTNGRCQTIALELWVQHWTVLVHSPLLLLPRTSAPASPPTHTSARGRQRGRGSRVEVEVGAVVLSLRRAEARNRSPHPLPATMAARILAAAALMGAATVSAQNSTCKGSQSFYTSKYQALLLNGSSVISYSSFAGNVLMISNVASF